MCSDSTGNACLDDSVFSFIMDNNHVGNGYTLTGDLPQLPPQYQDAQGAHFPFVCTGCMSKDPGLLFPEDSRVPENTRPNTQAGCSHRCTTTPLPNVSHQQTVASLNNTREFSLEPNPFSASATSHLDNADGQANNFVDDQTCGRCFETYHRNPVEKISRKYECHWKRCTSRHEFTSEETLIRHLKSVHISPDKYKCSQGTCNESFGRKDKLRAHVKSAHKG